MKANQVVIVMDRDRAERLCMVNPRPSDLTALRAALAVVSGDTGKEGASDE